MTAPWSRWARHATISSRSWASTAGSTVRKASSPSRGEGTDSVNELTPITFWSPDSMRRVRSAWLVTNLALSSSMASKAPPMPMTSSSSALAASASSVVFASTTWEPSKMSPCSRRSVS